MARFMAKDIHMPSEFGKVSCPFAPLTLLAMICFADKEVFPLIERKFSISSRFTKSPQEFAKWLLVDEISKPAMLFQFIEDLRKFLPIDGLVQ